MRIGRNDLSISSRWMQWVLVLALATIALAIAGTDSILAEPDDALSRDDVRTACLMSGGIFWESGSAYGCDLGGLTILCDGAGSCEY